MTRLAARLAIEALSMAAAYCDVATVLSNVGRTRHHVRMSDWVTSAIAAGAALAGAALSAIVAASATRRQLASQDRTGLAAALQSYGYAITNLGMEIDQLPPRPSPTVAALSAASASRLPLLDWTASQISRHTVGRPTRRAVDTYNAAMNRLLLVAPQSILTHMKTINDLVTRADHRGDAWAEAWSHARAAFTEASRQAIQPPQPRWRRLHRRIGRRA
jgi:hypothetical protein